MNREVSSQLEMGARALEFSRAHPVDSPGYITTVKQLEELLVRANQLAMEQERGIAEVRATTARKRELKRSLRRRQLVHLGRVAKKASRELPELAQKFDLPRIPSRNLAFRAVGRILAEEAQQHRELLVKYGLVEQVLDSIKEGLDEFDVVVERGAEGRRVHIGASANLQAVGDEIVQIVKILDGFNRYRFAAEPDLLAAWLAASNIVGPPQARIAQQPTQEGNINPAA